MHETCEEAEGMKSAPTGFDVGAACLVVAVLGALQNGGDAFEVGGAGVDVKRQRRDQGIGAVADLAQRDGRIFPPAAARSGEPRTDG